MALNDEAVIMDQGHCAGHAWGLAAGSLMLLLALISIPETAKGQVLDIVEDAGECSAEIGCQIAQPADAFADWDADCIQAASSLRVLVRGAYHRVIVATKQGSIHLNGTLFTDRLIEAGENCYIADFLLPLAEQSYLQLDAFNDAGRINQTSVILDNSTDWPVASVDLAAPVRRIEFTGPKTGLTRTLRVYAPPSIRPGANASVLLLLDGQNTAYIARILEALASEALHRPVIVIGVDARMTPPAGRAEDYLPDFNPAAHQAFRKYFVEDLAVWIQGEFGDRIAATGWSVYGASSGASFALSLVGQEGPISTIIATSPSAGLRQIPEEGASAGQQVHLAIGAYETRFLNAAEQTLQTLNDADLEVTVRCYLSGHDSHTFDTSFRDAMLAVLGAARSQRAEAETCLIPR